MYGQSSTKAR